MTVDGSWLLGLVVVVVVVVLRRQGASWVRVIGTVAVVLIASGLAVLLLVALLHLLS